jgi:hypothetical protein
LWLQKFAMRSLLKNWFGAPKVLLLVSLSCMASRLLNYLPLAFCSF